MDNKETNYVSCVIYVHNAADRVEDFLSFIIRVMEENFLHSEIICVNDASEDDSLSAMKKAAEKAVLTSVSVVNMSWFHGLELAMNAGTDLAIGDFVFEFDSTCADFPPETIMEVYRRSLEGYDIVSASPDVKEKFSSHLFYRIFDRYSTLSTRMTTERFRVLSRRVINRISSMNKSVLYRKALYAASGLKTDNLRYRPVRSAASSTMDANEKNYRSGLAVDSLILFTNVGYRFSMTMTLVMMLISVFVLAYTLITYFTSHPVEGWTTTILFLSVSFFGLFAILTIIIKYLQLLIDMIFKRRRYSFESIEKLTK